jgi:hypothetical protein
MCFSSEEPVPRPQVEALETPSLAATDDASLKCVPEIAGESRKVEPTRQARVLLFHPTVEQASALDAPVGTAPAAFPGVHALHL